MPSRTSFFFTPLILIVPAANSGATRPLSAGSQTSLRTAVIRTLIGIDPRQRGLKGNRRALRQAVADAAGARLLEEYEGSSAPVRFEDHPAVRTPLGDSIDPVTMEAFLISSAIAGVRMTEPWRDGYPMPGAGAAN